MWFVTSTDLLRYKLSFINLLHVSTSYYFVSLYLIETTIRWVCPGIQSKCYVFREMMIVFVYDTAKCCKEEDDPAEAVMYFHPAWVSLTQRLALAGQLMGVHHFLTTSFSAPRSITLQGGKFVLKKFGQYVLVSTFHCGTFYCYFAFIWNNFKQNITWDLYTNR